MPDDRRKTQFDMEDIINRCLDECVDAEYILREEVAPDTIRLIIKNKKETVAHISKTLIGELLEFEIVRRSAPWFREYRRLDADLQIVTEAQLREQGLASLRLQPLPDLPKPAVKKPDDQTA